MTTRDEETLPGAEPPAVVYDRFFVPALFSHWAPVVADAAGIGPGQRVLDVACGTGVLACTAAERVGVAGTVAGIDPNDEMLGVARTKRSRVEWQQGKAESLPFADETFDAVVSQFGLMFFDDKRASLQEAMRVLKRGGRLAFAVCDGLDHSPGYAVFTELLHRLFGAEAADAFRAPFVLGDRSVLTDLCLEAGLPEAQVTRRDEVVRFASIASLVTTERACAWTLGGVLSETQFARLLDEAEESLAPFVSGRDGAIEFVMPALLVTATKQ